MRSDRWALPVLGMHRSGTSLATRLLAFAGAPMAPGSAAGRSRHVANPEGFWEIPLLTDCNERLLRLLGGAWSAPPPLEAGWTQDERLQRLRSSARRLAARELTPAGALWKDPRLSLTLPFWEDLLGPVAALVLVLREPVDVADSLHRRNRLDRATSFALWERHVRSAFAVATGRPALVLAFEELVADPHGVTERSRAWMSGAGQPLGDAAGAEVVREFVRAPTPTDPVSDATGDDHMTTSQQRLREAAAALVGGHEALPALDVAPPAAESLQLLEARRLARSKSARQRPPIRRVRRWTLARLSARSRRARRS